MRWLSDRYTTRFSSPPDLNLFYKTNASWITPFHCVYTRHRNCESPSPSSTPAKICSILIPLPRNIPPSRKGRKDLFYPYPFTTNNPRQVAKAAKDLFYPHPLTTNNPRQVAKVAKIPQRICLFLAALRLVRGIPIVFYTHIQNPLSFKNLSAGGLNPCAHVGRDASASILPSCSLFQSTRPRGARQRPSKFSIDTYIFHVKVLIFNDLCKLIKS